MCLNRVREVQEPTKEVSYGWKIFAYYPGKKLEFKYRHFRGSSLVPRRRWLKAVRKKLFENGSFFRGEYESGFHFYTTRDGARYAASGYYFTKIVRVKVRGVHTFGIQGESEVGVAREMLVP